MSREQSFAQLKEVVAAVRGAERNNPGNPDNARTAINVSLSTVFGCPMEGDIDEAEVLRWMARFAELGVDGFTLCDTTGMAYPSQVEQLCGHARNVFPQAELTLHFHNTRGMALANALAAIAAGIDRFDSSLGGLGGCPYAPGATGNVCTEDLAHMLQLMGYDTGIDLTALLQASARLPGLIGHDVPSQVLKAGRRLDLHARPDYLIEAERSKEIA